ncbi:MAG: hypothetical protein K2G75_02345, partial [Muribaculaceae bacterium]|nr:hypothetical protein [Muribaculaceae bacterium]
MKKNYRRGLASLLLCFLIPLAAVGAVAETSAPSKKRVESASAGVKSTFESPDFAYPATVRDDAQKVYSSAMRSGKPLEALKAAMEMAVADRLTSSDSVAVTLGRYREIAEKFAAPYSSMASLLEASTLASLYQSSPYVFDSRVLPLDSRDAEPLLWSGDQLRDAVASLCESALAARDVLSGCPIGDLAYILTSTADADRFGMSAFDFAVYRILDITAGCGIDRRQNSRLP